MLPHLRDTSFSNLVGLSLAISYMVNGIFSWRLTNYDLKVYSSLLGVVCGAAAVSGAWPSCLIAAVAGGLVTAAKAFNQGGDTNGNVRRGSGIIHLASNGTVISENFHPLHTTTGVWDKIINEGNTYDVTNNGTFFILKGNLQSKGFTSHLFKRSDQIQNYEIHTAVDSNSKSWPNLGSLDANALAKRVAQVCGGTKACDLGAVLDAENSDKEYIRFIIQSSNNDVPYDPSP